MDDRNPMPPKFFSSTPDQNCMCPTDPDLLLLRRMAISERKGIYFYLCAAEKTSGSLCKLFTEIAEDEMVHFRNIMTLLARYDPVQCCAFNDVCITLPCIDSFRKSKSCSNLEAIDLLTRAIVDELCDANNYQESYCAAQHKVVKILFCNNGNDEKVHAAKLWKCLMAYTNENTCKP